MGNITRYRANTKKHIVIIQGLMHIIDGLVKILSFGYLKSNFAVMYILKKKHKK